MKIWKGFLAVFLMCTMMFLLLPSPVMAEDTWEGVGLIVLGILLLGGLYMYIAVGLSGWDNTFNFGLGDMILDVQDDTNLLEEFSPLQNLSALSGERIDYNIDWLLTERTEDRVWVGAGLTINKPPGFTGFNLAENDYGCNLLIGYSQDSWDQKWLVTYLPDGEIKATVEVNYWF